MVEDIARWQIDGRCGIGCSVFVDGGCQRMEKKQADVVAVNDE